MAVIATTASEDATAGRSEDCGSAEQMNIVGLIIDQLIFDSCMTKFVTFLREGGSVRTYEPLIYPFGLWDLGFSEQLNN